MHFILRPTTTMTSLFTCRWLGLSLLLFSPLLLGLVKAQDASTFVTVYNLVDGNFAQSDAKTLMRLGFHDAMGGLDGRIDTSNSEHNGLINVFNSLDTLYNNNNNLGLGRSDFFAWAYVAAFYIAIDGNDLPWVPLTYGRADVGSGASEDIPPDSEFGSFDQASVLSYFADHFGFNTRDTAIIMGAHTMGGADSGNSGFVGDWTNSPNEFNADYYDTMVNPPGQSGRWEQVEVATNKFEWRWGCGGNNGCRDLMLNVDMSMFFDITYDSTGKAVLPSGSSCSSNRIFDDCFPSQTSGTQDVVNEFLGQSSNFRTAFAPVYGNMLNRVKTSSSLTTIDQPAGWPDLDSIAAVEESSCFSKLTEVQVEHKGVVQMQQLQVGDRVWTGTKFESVYAWGHHHEQRVGKFLVIQTAGTNTSNPLEMTEDHLVFREMNGNTEAVPAGDVEVGDVVQLSPVEGPSRTTVVTHISSVLREGLYMPLVPSGTIVVDGILASAYVCLRRMAPNVAEDSESIYPFLSDHKVSHWWMSPYRMTCLGVSTSLCKDPVRDEEGILWWLLAGKRFAEFTDQHGFFVRVLLLGVPTFLLFGLLNAAEVLLGGPSVAPVAFLAILCATVCIAKRQQKGAKMKTR